MANEKVLGFHVKEWAKEYLKEGMIVKVKTASRNKLRLVTAISLQKLSFYGLHIVHSNRSAPRYKNGQYLTSHLLDKITGVMCDDNGVVIVDMSESAASISCLVPGNAIMPDEEAVSHWVVKPISKFIKQAKAFEDDP